MPPNADQDRRAADHSAVARIAWSPWTNIVHLVGTGAIIIALVGLFGTMYSNQNVQDQQIQKLEISQSDAIEKLLTHEALLAALGERVTANRDSIHRVEMQAEQDRQRILNQLERLGDQLDELNNHLRDANAAISRHKGSPAAWKPSTALR